jgi:uncharacterized protein YjbI with pentapeptide repeats
MADAKKIDPFDVEALEKSLNDSATRVSTIWISFLIFSLYLLTAATTVTHRQLFLADPVKLPVLNIELPLWGFFWLAPILFVIFHAYVLIQLILLARTAAAYDVAIAKLAERDDLSLEANASLRQRLANTLFAQILAGSPREREGWFGSLLKAMAWITLVIAPILILLTFQFMFLPYHSHLATWTHRALILLELVVAFKLWPLVLNPQRDFQWPSYQLGLRKRVVRMTSLFGSSEGRQRVKSGLRQLTMPMAATVLFILLSLSLATFPGELHVNLFTGQAIDGVQCGRWIQQKFEFADMRFDRLDVSRVDIVDDEKLDKIRNATRNAGQQPFEGERTHLFRDRNFNCGDFSEFADLRHVDFSGARLRSARFKNSKLDGAVLDRAQLQGASFEEAHIIGASLKEAHLQGASLTLAELDSANLDLAELQRASLVRTRLAGASLSGAQLQGASLFDTQLQGASLWNAQLQGASLLRAMLQGALLTGAQLQGAFISGSKLQGALLNRANLAGAFVGESDVGAKSIAELQGVSLKDAVLDHTILSRVRVWRTRDANCLGARVIDPDSSAVIGQRANGALIPAMKDEIEKLIASSTSKIPELMNRKELMAKSMYTRLVVEGNDDTETLAGVWHQCASAVDNEKDFDDRHIDILRKLVCDAKDSSPISFGITRNWISDDHQRVEFKSKLAQVLLDEDGRLCAATKRYDEWTIKRLRAAASPPPAQPAPKIPAPGPK